MRRQKKFLNYYNFFYAKLNLKEIRIANTLSLKNGSFQV